MSLTESAKAGNLQASGQELAIALCVVLRMFCVLHLRVTSDPRHNSIASPLTCVLTPRTYPSLPCHVRTSPTQQVKALLAAGVKPDDERDGVNMLYLDFAQCLGSG